MKQKQHIVGSISLDKLPRIAELFKNVAGNVNIAVKIAPNEIGLPTLTGTISTSVALVCQRCLQHYEHKIARNINLALVTTTSAEREYSKMYDTLLLEGDKLALYLLIEDEILLDLPLIPKHSDENDCKIVYNSPLKQTEGSLVSEESNQTKPFAGLRNLINQ